MILWLCGLMWLHTFWGTEILIIEKVQHSSLTIYIREAPDVSKLPCLCTRSCHAREQRPLKSSMDFPWVRTRASSISLPQGSILAPMLLNEFIKWPGCWGRVHSHQLHPWFITGQSCGCAGSSGHPSARLQLHGKMGQGEWPEIQ